MNVPRIIELQDCGKVCGDGDCDNCPLFDTPGESESYFYFSEQNVREAALEMLNKVCPNSIHDEAIDFLFERMKREVNVGTTETI